VQNVVQAKQWDHDLKPIRQNIIHI
jgi:hypothetical protein